MRGLTTLAATALLPLAALAQQANDSIALEGTYPVVITPTRLRQALPDVPASVTIITSAQIARLGINSVAEALRLVPGMELTRAAGHDWRISYHGTNILTPRRMNVLVDGVSFHRPGYSRVFWQQLPVTLADIDRIDADTTRRSSVCRRRPERAPAGSCPRFERCSSPRLRATANPRGTSRTRRSKGHPAACG